MFMTMRPEAAILYDRFAFEQLAFENRAAIFARTRRWAPATLHAALASIEEGMDQQAEVDDSWIMGETAEACGFLEEVLVESMEFDWGCAEVSLGRSHHFATARGITQGRTSVKKTVKDLPFLMAVTADNPPRPRCGRPGAPYDPVRALAMIAFTLEGLDWACEPW